MEDNLSRKTDGNVSGVLLGQVSENLKKLVSRSEPFKHWIFDGVLLEETIDELLKLPLALPKIEKHTGKREAQNQTRVFFNKNLCDKHPVIKNIVNFFIIFSPKVILSII